MIILLTCFRLLSAKSRKDNLAVVMGIRFVDLPLLFMAAIKGGTFTGIDFR